MGSSPEDIAADALRAKLASVPGIERTPAIEAQVKTDDTRWHIPTPMIWVGGFLFNKDLNFPLIEQGGRYCVPAALHQNGVSMAERLALVGMDELNAMFSLGVRHRYLGAYENIFGKDGWHSVVNMLALYPIDIRYLRTANITLVGSMLNAQIVTAKFQRVLGSRHVVIVRCDTGEMISNWAAGLGEWLEVNVINLRKMAAEICRPAPTDQFSSPH